MTTEVGSGRVNVGELCACLHYPHPRRFDVFLLSFCRTRRALCLIWGNDRAVE